MGASETLPFSLRSHASPSPFHPLAPGNRLARRTFVPPMNELFDKKTKPGRGDMRIISIKGAREHNLKNVDLDIPRDALVVFTGPVSYTHLTLPTILRV